MDQKPTGSAPEQTISENDDLRIVVDELNQNVAFLSRMVMQLQNSLITQKSQVDKTATKASQGTIH